MGLRLSSFPDAGLLDGTELVGLVQKGQTVKAQVNDIAIIAKGPPGSPGEGYPTRAALSDVIALARDDAYLTEPGREGKFVFDDTNFATQFGASLAVVDPAQGKYVPPASDPTGASGAWVRKYTGAINPRWFGISDANSGATNSSAFTALKAALKALATLSGAYGSLPRVSFPDDKTYNFAATLELDSGSMILTADVPATPTTGATIKVPAGVTAIRPQRHDTDGTAGNTGTGIGADGSIIERLRIIGGYTTTEAEVHGVEIRAHNVKVRDCFISSFEGDGINVHADVTPADNGNANCTMITDNIISNNRNGIYFDGGNSNAGSTRGNDTSNNRQWGIWDSSFLGNWHFAGITENSGICAGTYTPSMVSYAGNQYACVAGQEVGAKTNSPSGTTADNTYWYYCQAGGPDTVNYNIPAWVSGTTYRAGGPIRTDNNNAGNIICGYYAEVGQGPMQLVWPTLLLGGDIFSGVRGVSYLRHDDTGLKVEGGLTLSGNLATSGTSVRAGPTSGAAADVQVFLDQTNFHSFITGRHWSGGVSVSIGTIDFNGIVNTIDLNPQVAGGYIRFQNLGTDIATVTSSAIDIQLGKVLKVAGSTVLTATALSLGTLTVATLPASPAVGTRAFVTDANAATFGTVVAGGGANKVPVYYDGAWKIG